MRLSVLCSVDVGLCLSSDKAILHHDVARGPESVPVGSPGEDLDPADQIVRMVGLVATGQLNGVSC